MTQHFGASTKGKQQIITAYLNQNYYGNQSYGVKAAARSYFGKELEDLTPGRGGDHSPALPKSPSNYDLVRNAESSAATRPVAEGEPCPAAASHLVVAADTRRSSSAATRSSS